MEVEPYALDLASPFETARGAIERREGYVVRVSHEGAEGVGEAAPLPGFTESPEACAAALERASEVASREGLEAAAGTLEAAKAPAATHAVATALLDASARRVGQPLYRLLGGQRRETVPANATLGDDDPEATARAAEAAVAAGFGTLKVKVGARDVDGDLARLRAVREAVGGAVALRADANGVWSRAEARAFCEGCENVALEYLEQPLAAGDLKGHARLREVADGVPIAVDESVAEAGPDAVLAAGAADAVVLKPMALGSPARVRAVARDAREAGVSATVTTTVDAVVARTAAVHVAASLPTVTAAGLATAGLLQTDLGPDPAPVVEGNVRVPQTPGLGVEEVCP